MCKGHGNSVDAIAASPSGKLLLSGSWDHSLRLWRIPDAGEVADAAAAAAGTKKAKTSASASAAAAAVVTSQYAATDEAVLASEATFSGHTQNVSCVCWPSSSSSHAYSCAWDHSIKLWDTTSGVAVRSWSAGKSSSSSVSSSSSAMSALAFSDTHNLLASAHNDTRVRLWDPRTPSSSASGVTSSSASSSAVKSVLTGGHSQWVSDVAWQRDSRAHNLLASCSHDGTVCLWDVRSVQSPVAVLRGHDDKVLCVDWHMSSSSSSDDTTAGVMVISGGADQRLHSHVVKRH